MLLSDTPPLFSPDRPGATPLNDRQLACLRWVEAGKSAADIGGILGLSGRTVEYHLARACETLGVRTRFQAVLIARDRGWLRPADT